MLQLDALDRGILDRLHPSAVEDRGEVRALMTRLWREAISLRRGVNRQISPELAQIEQVHANALTLRLYGFETSRRSQLWLNFELDALPYFFAAQIVDYSDHRATTRLPELVYRAERRDRARQRPESRSPLDARVVIDSNKMEPIAARIADRSAGGFGVEVEAGANVRIGSAVALSVVDANGHSATWRGSVRHSSPSPSGAGWQKLGISVLGGGDSSLLVESAPATVSWKKARRTWEIVAAGAAARSAQLVKAVTRRTAPAPHVEILDFFSSSGDRIRALANRSGPEEAIDVPIVLIPPAWGRTKETLLPLASTLVETFRRAREPMLAIRFDGIRRRGESANDPDCRSEGSEYHRFTFSQAVEDIRTVVNALREDPRYTSSKIVLVTFSAASIDGRRAVAIDRGESISGWVSVVGSADLQSMMRVVSGGVDFIRGLESGVSFGLQEILGVGVDIDRAGLDAIKSRNAYLDDSCKDMEQIRVPVTWIHGRHDAWMDLERSRLMLSSGDAANRKLIVVPTGHQLRTSREALEVFQLITQEVSQLALGRELTPRLPSLADVDSRRRAERDRLPKKDVDQRAFWKRYLLGRDGSLGMELMTYSSPYLTFMKEQIRALNLEPGDVVADYGSGTGALLSALERSGACPARLAVVQLDYVHEALLRSRARQQVGRTRPVASHVLCDLAGDGEALSIPIADASFDAALASLFVSYVSDPRAVLREIGRTLKPGGHLVVSGLRRDADVSKLFVEANAEIKQGGGINLVDGVGAIDLQRASRDFLNDAARLLDLEEIGLFEFRDSQEMAELLESSGFEVNKVWGAFGDPPQAIVVSGVKAKTK